MAFAVERLIAFRYLRARREEGFISVIAGFSLVGIALGVGTLIVVMSVMNGFRIEMADIWRSISMRKPFMTDMTTINVPTPSAMPTSEKPAITEMKPSSRRARK